MKLLIEKLFYRKDLRTLVFFLAISDFLLSSSIFVSQFWIFVNERTYSYTVCVVLRSMIQYASIASFFW